jgi:hypothetical protein
MADERPKPEEQVPPWIRFGLKPAATKKTGSYEDPPWVADVPRKPGEDDGQYAKRNKEERERAPRKRSGGAGGWCFAFPDVCYIPTYPSPTPIPFPNIDYLKDAINCTVTVFAEGKPVCHENSEIPITHWDDPGVVGGVCSGTFKQKVRFIEYSSKVFVENKALVFQGCRTTHNNQNIIGKFNKPGQKKVWAK